MDHKQNLPLQKVDEEKQSDMEQDHFAGDATGKPSLTPFIRDDKSCASKEDLRHPKKLNIFVHLIGQEYHDNPIHYNLNWNTEFDFVYQHFAGLVGIANDVPRKWTLVNDINLIPNVSFFEMFRQGFMTLSNVVHLTCYVGDAATTIELLTPIQTDNLHNELAFACLMLDNVELEELDSKRSTSNRLQRKFLKKIIREFYPSFEFTYHYDSFGEGGWYRIPINPMEREVEEPVVPQDLEIIDEEKFAAEVARLLTLEDQARICQDEPFLDLHPDSAARRIIENVQATLMVYKNDETLDRSRLYRSVYAFFAQAEGYLDCCRTNCTQRTHFYEVVDPTAMLFCPCGLLRLCRACLMNDDGLWRHQDDEVLRCPICRFSIQLPFSPFYLSDNDSYEHKVKLVKREMSEAIYGLLRWVSSPQPAPNLEEYAPLVEDSINDIRKRFVCFSCGYVMSTENHLIMRSSCSCATIMCRFCVFEKRMTTMISQQHLRTIPNCSAEMSDRNVVCDTCGEFTRFGLCIGLSIISVVCRILVLASDVTRAATLRELFIMTGRKLGYRFDDDCNMYDASASLPLKFQNPLTLQELIEKEDTVYNRSPVESSRNPYGCCAEYRKLHRAAVPTYSDYDFDNVSYQGSLSEEEDSLCEEEQLNKGAVDVKEYAELVEGLSHQSNAIQLFVSGTDLDETAHPAKRSPLVGEFNEHDIHKDEDDGDAEE